MENNAKNGVQSSFYENDGFFIKGLTWTEQVMKYKNKWIDEFNK